MTIIGIEESKGIYESNAYHNIIIHSTENISTDKGIGLKAKTEKVKYKVLVESLGKELATKEIYALLGKAVKCHYDNFKNVSLVQISEPEKPQGLSKV